MRRTSVAVLYLFHIFIFGSFLALSGYAEKSNRHALLCFKVRPKSQAGNPCYRALCAGGINHEDPDNPQDQADTILSIFFANYLAPLLCKPQVKVAITEPIEYHDPMVRENVDLILRRLENHPFIGEKDHSISWLRSYMQFIRSTQNFITYDFSSEETFVQGLKDVAITEPIEYHDPMVRENVDLILRRLENHPFIGEKDHSISWLRSYMQFIRSTQNFITYDFSSEETFVQGLKDYFLPGLANPFAMDVFLDEEGTRIKASRFYVRLVNMTDIDDEIVVFKHLRHVADTTPYNVTVYHPFFIFLDAFVETLPAIIDCVVAATVVMLLVSLIFIPSPICAVWIAFSIVSIELGVMGYMSWWGINFDVVSMINLIMSIGFSVDFTAHISYAFITSKEPTSNGKLRDALHNLGPPIFQAAFSTMMSFFPLVLVPSYIYRTFFILTSMIMVFGFVHGVLLLPVLLTLLGPETCSPKVSSQRFQIQDSKPKPEEEEVGSEFYASKLRDQENWIFDSSNIAAGPFYLNNPEDLPDLQQQEEEEANTTGGDQLIRRFLKSRGMGDLPLRPQILPRPSFIRSTQQVDDERSHSEQPLERISEKSQSVQMVI
ncbi:unnamed protein product [Cyprideis torosa]|uniref:Uncharacterized protein n=1 Tax=Cyprideis torosa TaxID=163714 RepID=A0A7R8ZPD6_9CRUS|nr:unnamed protein product [Cyprideis torosa]CAG0889615.1 unnamed protein product [Cyprideis torosa]